MPTTINEVRREGGRRHIGTTSDLTDRSDADPPGIIGGAFAFGGALKFVVSTGFSLRSAPVAARSTSARPPVSFALNISTLAISPRRRYFDRAADPFRLRRHASAAP